MRYFQHVTATISNNYVFNNTSGGDGGGLYVAYNDATLTGNIVTGNTASNGGGLYLSGSDATLSGNAVISNTASDGGGLYVSSGNVTLTTNTVTSNTADYGGGLYVSSGDVMLTANTVTSNTAEYDGGGLYLYFGSARLVGNTISSNSADWGGGLYLISFVGTPTLIANTIKSNTASMGGGLYLGASDATLIGNIISGNTVSGRGGGLHLCVSDSTLTGNTIISNTASTGGGLSLHASGATLSANIIASNVAEIRGGGLDITVNSDAVLDNNVIADNVVLLNQVYGIMRGGSGLYIGDSSPHLRHTTIARNTGGDGSGVRVENVFYSSTVTLTNTIIVGHSTGITVTAGNTATLSGVLWFDNGTNAGGAGAIYATNQYIGDPAFAPDGYHLTANSAALDQGVDSGVTTDIDGQTRPHYEGYDLGADEWWPLVAVKTVTPGTAEPSDVVTYTLALTNTTDAAMTVRLTDTLPTQVGYLGPLAYNNGSGDYASGVVTWTGTVLTATPTLITWPVQVAPDVPGGITITNTAAVSDAYGLFQTNPALILVPLRYVYLPLVLRNY